MGISIGISEGCLNNAPKLAGLKQQNFPPLTVLEAASLDRGFHRAMLPLALWADPFLASS